MSNSTHEPAIGERIAAREIAEAATTTGAIWSITSTDLNMNVVVITHETPIERHRNSEVDVVVIGVAGAGTVIIDEAEIAIQSGNAVVIPKGAWRSIRSGADRFVYMTIHRRRAGLWPTSASPAHKTE